MMKLAIVSTHPIQYYAPLFRKLALNRYFDIKVFYTWSQAKDIVFDPGFGKRRVWDIPLLEGYKYTFVENISMSAGSHHFRGINNPSLTHEIQSWKANAILIFGWNFKSHLRAIRFFKAKIKVLFRGDSTLLDETHRFSLKKMLRRIFLTWVYRHIDYALYVGTANKAYYLAHGVPEKKLIFAPHAIDNKRFSSNNIEFSAESKRYRSKLGISENNIVFLYAGKLTPKKNPELLIKAFIKLNANGCHLVIVGNGELEDVLKEKYSYCKKITFLDFQNQSKMPVIYHLADVFCLPSKGPGETWGLSVNEAMACGKAVIVSDRCGCAFDLIKDGENGYIFKSENILELSAKMKLLISDQQKIKEMGRKSLQIIDTWKYENIVKSIESIYER